MTSFIAGTEDTTVFLEFNRDVSFDYLSSNVGAEDIDDGTCFDNLGNLGWFGGILQVAKRCINWRDLVWR